MLDCFTGAAEQAARHRRILAKRLDGRTRRRNRNSGGRRSLDCRHVGRRRYRGRRRTNVQLSQTSHRRWRSRGTGRRIGQFSAGRQLRHYANPRDTRSLALSSAIGIGTARLVVLHRIDAASPGMGGNRRGSTRNQRSATCRRTHHPGLRGRRVINRPRTGAHRGRGRGRRAGQHVADRRSRDGRRITGVAVSSQGRLRRAPWRPPCHNNRSADKKQDGDELALHEHDPGEQRY